MDDEAGLNAALERLAGGTDTPEDIARLRAALAGGRLTLASGAGSIGIGGGVHGSTLITGGVHINLDAAALARLSPPAPARVAPGQLPPGSYLPFLRNQTFTGRAEDLQALARALLEGEGSPGSAPGGVLVSEAVAATGLGGLGKTQLAVEFCYAYGHRTAGVHWVPADQDIGAGVAACGAQMGLEPWPNEQPEQVRLTLLAWGRAGPRLVVLDNAEDLDTLLEWLPRLRGCRVLLTARRGEWPPDLGLKQHRLGTLARSESLALLRKLAPRLEDVRDAELGALAERLGDLPLALDLAGRYLALRRRLVPKDYIKALDEAGSALAHGSLGSAAGYSPTQHDTDLAATFGLSWAQVSDELAYKLLRAAGYCAANTPIPWALLHAAAGEGVDEESFDRASATLAELGLWQASDMGPSLHPLLAEFARLQDGEAGESALPGLAQALGGLSYEALESGLPERMKPLRPHLAQGAAWAEQAGQEQAGGLWNNLGSHLKDMAEYAGARVACERALASDERVYGPDHPKVATDVNNLGNVLRDLGELAGARAACERALASDERTYGPDHPTVAIRANNLGKVLQDLGDLAGAQAAFERALRIRERTLPDNYPDIGTTLNDLGNLYRIEGNYQEAKYYLERALGIYKQAFGEQHHLVAISVNNLGQVLRDLGDLAGARAAFEQALLILEKQLGPEHPFVAKATNNLGGVLQDLGDLAGARAACERALAIGERAYGQDHPEVATDVNNLGLVLQDLGDLAGARAAYERALRIWEQTFGSEHPMVATGVNNLGSVLRDLGDLAEARAAFERALASDEGTFGPDHPKVAIRVNNLGRVLQDLGDLAGARAAYERALRIFEKSLPEDHPNIRVVREKLAGLEDE